MWSLAQEALWLAALPPTHPHRADYLAEKAVRDSVLRTVERDRGEGPWPSSPSTAPSQQPAHAGVSAADCLEAGRQTAPGGSQDAEYSASASSRRDEAGRAQLAMPPVALSAFRLLRQQQQQQQKQQQQQQTQEQAGEDKAEKRGGARGHGMSTASALGGSGADVFDRSLLPACSPAVSLPLAPLPPSCHPVCSALMLSCRSCSLSVRPRCVCPLSLASCPPRRLPFLPPPSLPPPSACCSWLTFAHMIRQEEGMDASWKQQTLQLAHAQQLEEQEQDCGNLFSPLHLLRGATRQMRQRVQAGARTSTSRHCAFIPRVLESLFCAHCIAFFRAGMPAVRRMRPAVKRPRTHMAHTIIGGCLHTPLRPQHARARPDDTLATCAALAQTNGVDEAAMRQQIVQAYDTGHSTLEQQMHRSLHRVSAAVQDGTCSTVDAPLLFQHLSRSAGKDARGSGAEGDRRQRLPSRSGAEGDRGRTPSIAGAGSRQLLAHARARARHARGKRRRGRGGAGPEPHA